MRVSKAVGSLALVGLAACGGSKEQDGSGGDGSGDGSTGSVSVAVQALELSGVSDACYDLTVTNADGETMFAETLCSSQYGSGSGMDLTYIGTCDASANDNLATLRVAALLDANGQEVTGFVDPCGEEGCSLGFTCVENGDVAVEFDLTFARALGSGFVDVSVNADDLFVSAKLDCAYPDGTPIELLTGPQGRLQTAVMAFACSAGPGEETVLYMNDATVVCADGTSSVSPDADGVTVGDPPVTASGVFRGTQTVSLGDVSAEVRYWNVALGIESFARDCRLVGSATCSEGPLADGTTPSSAPYPVIRFDVPLSGTSGGLICGQNGLNDATGGVTVEYAAEPETFDFSFGGSTRD